MAVADHYFRQLTVPATQRALALTPGQAPYWTRLALLLAGDDPARSEAAWERAAALNPLDANPWVELGLRSENRRDLVAAERYLLRAAEVDTGYLPRWSLANYYFRRQYSAKFWPWVRGAAAMVYGDPSALFDLCWRFTGDGEHIAQILAIGKPSLQARYLAFLLDRNRMAYVPSAARRLLDWNREEDTPLLLRTCERLLEERRTPHAFRQAIEIWNALAHAHRVPDGRLASEGGVSLTNGRFASAPSSRGFDWRVATLSGVATTWQENPTGIRFVFSGRQPEKCEFLQQIIPVAGNRRYQLAFRYHTVGVPPESGLRWRVVEEGIAGSKVAILAESASLSSQEEAQGGLSFVTGVRSRLVRLNLGYERALGSTRIEGSLHLSDVQLILQPR